MKKLTALLVVSFMILAGCAAKEGAPPDNNGDVETPQEEPAETPEDPEEPGDVNAVVLSDFKESIREAEDPLEVRRAMDTIMGEESEKTNDAVLWAYLNYLTDFREDGMAPYYEDMQKLQPYFEEGTQNLMPASITEQTLLDFHSRFTEMGYGFVQLEGTIEPVVDYNIIEKFHSFISQEMKDYGAFLSLESTQMWAADGEIAIPIIELGQRIAEGEGFLASYPDSDKKVPVKEILGYYLSSFFGGLPNTPVAVEGSYSQEFLFAYEEYLSEHPDTRTAAVLKTYYDALEEMDFAPPYTIDDPASQSQFREETTERVDEILGGF